MQTRQSKLYFLTELKEKTILCTTLLFEDNKVNIFFDVFFFQAFTLGDSPIKCLYTSMCLSTLILLLIINYSSRAILLSSFKSDRKEEPISIPTFYYLKCLTCLSLWAGCLVSRCLRRSYDFKLVLSNTWLQITQGGLGLAFLGKIKIHL